MARDHARVKLSIWDDDDFRALSPAAQHLYFVLMTSPDLNYAGVADWRPNRIAKFAGSWTPGGVEIAAQELSEQLYIVIDVDTEEVLIRSFIRSDELMEQPNLAVAMRKAHAALASSTLRAVVVHELRRLHDDKPDLKGWKRVPELLGRPSIDPSVLPSFNASVDPSGKGDANPSGNPSVCVSPTTSPTPATSPTPPTATTKVTTPGEDRHLPARASTATEPTPTSPADARCTTHTGVTDPGPCKGCQAARLAAERTLDRETDHARRQREQAVRNCPDCEGTHLVIDPVTKLPTNRRCTHPNTTRRTA